MKTSDNGAAKATQEASFSIVERVACFYLNFFYFNPYHLCEGDKTESTGHFDESNVLPGAT
jgi:hypothetical protein